MDIDEHKKIILQALNDYRLWFGAVINEETDEDAEKLDAIDNAIDAVLGIV